MADSLKKLAQMYAKQLHPGYKQIHQIISDHVTKAIEVRIKYIRWFYVVIEKGINRENVKYYTRSLSLESQSGAA